MHTGLYTYTNIRSASRLLCLKTKPLVSRKRCGICRLECIWVRTVILLTLRNCLPVGRFQHHTVNPPVTGTRCMSRVAEYNLYAANITKTTTTTTQAGWR